MSGVDITLHHVIDIDVQEVTHGQNYRKRDIVITYLDLVDPGADELAWVECQMELTCFIEEGYPHTNLPTTVVTNNE